MQKYWFMIACVSLFNGTNNAVHHRCVLKYIPLYFVELSGYPELYSVIRTLGQNLGFGSKIMQFKYEKIVRTTETDGITEQIIVPLFVVYIYS